MSPKPHLAARDPREPPFRIGDVVSLNSGGPRLLIVEVGQEGITVAWRDAGGITREQLFPAACLHRARIV